MSRGLVILVSGQPVPNVQAFRALGPDRAWMLITPQMEREGRWLVRALDRARVAPPGGIVQVRVANPRLPGPTRETLRERVFARNPGWEWDVMLSGGTKPMVLGAWQACVEAGGRPLYMDLSRPTELLDLRDGKTIPVPGTLPLEPFLLAHGYRGEGQSIPWSRVEEALAWEMARVATRPAFLDAEGVIHPEAPPVLAAELARKVPGLADGQVEDSRWRTFLSGGWLEVFLWSLLRQAGQSLGLRDVTRGLRIAEQEGDVRNELDIAAMHPSGLLAIEAKTGQRVGEEAIYKFATVLHQVRALGMHGVLACAGPASGAMKGALRQRARLLGLRLLDGRDIEVLAVHPDARTLAGVLGLPREQDR